MQEAVQSESGSGFAYTCVIVQEVRAPGKPVKAERSLVLRTETSGKYARLAIVSGATKAVAARDYLLTRDGGATFYVVSPDKKEYREKDVRALGVAAAEIDTKGARFSLRDFQQTVTAGAGELLLGRPTERSGFSRRYQMRIRILFFGTTLTCSDTAEYWVAPSLAGVLNPAAAYQEAAVGALIGVADKARFDQEQTARARPGAGMPMKVVWRERAAEGNKKPTETTTTLVVRDLARLSTVAARFELPSGYRRK